MKRPLSTIVWMDGIRGTRGRRLRWLVRLVCGHEAIVMKKPRSHGDHPCSTCASLRTPRAYRIVRQLAYLNLTEREVEYLAGRLAEERVRGPKRRKETAP